MLDFKIQHENHAIEKAMSVLESNLKNSIGTGLNKSLMALINESQEPNPYDTDHRPGLGHRAHRKAMKHLKEVAHELDDLFLSRHGYKVRPDRKKRPKHRGDDALLNKPTDLDKMMFRRKVMKDKN